MTARAAGTAKVRPRLHGHGCKDWISPHTDNDLLWKPVNGSALASTTRADVSLTLWCLVWALLTVTSYAEERPSCEYCIAQGWMCTYEIRLRWESDLVSAGLAFGRSKRGTKDGEQQSGPSLSCLPPRTARLHWLNTTVSDFSYHNHGSDDASDPTSSDSPGQGFSISVPTSIWEYSSLDDFRGTLQQYCEFLTTLAEIVVD